MSNNSRRKFSAGVQALLALAGEACTPVMANMLKLFVLVFPSSCLGTQEAKLQLPESRSLSFASWVPNLEIGNQRHSA